MTQSSQKTIEFLNPAFKSAVIFKIKDNKKIQKNNRRFIRYVYLTFTGVVQTWKTSVTDSPTLSIPPIEEMGSWLKPILISISIRIYRKRGKRSTLSLPVTYIFRWLHYCVLWSPAVIMYNPIEEETIPPPPCFSSLVCCCQLLKIRPFLLCIFFFFPFG